MNSNTNSPVNSMNANVPQAPINHVEIPAAHVTALTQDVDVVDDDLLYATPPPLPAPIEFSQFDIENIWEPQVLPPLIETPRIAVPGKETPLLKDFYLIFLKEFQENPCMVSDSGNSTTRLADVVSEEDPLSSRNTTNNQTVYPEMRGAHPLQGESTSQSRPREINFDDPQQPSTQTSNPTKKRKFITNKVVLEVKQLVESGLTFREIGAKLGYAAATVNRKYLEYCKFGLLEDDTPKHIGRVSTTKNDIKPLIMDLLFRDLHLSLPKIQRKLGESGTTYNIRTLNNWVAGPVVNFISQADQNCIQAD